VPEEIFPARRAPSKLNVAFTLKLNMEMRRIMIAEIHSDDDPEESRDDRHDCFLADSGI
jgi:hypothetical protein